MNPIIDEFKAHAVIITQTLKKEFAGIRTNRPTTALVEDIKVNYYNQTMPLKQLGNIGITPPREIHIQVWDAGAVSAVIKAIESSSLGLTANVEGNTIRIYLPELSTERREELAKHVKKIAEEHKIKLRHVRDDANKKVQKGFDDHAINEDQKFKLKEEIQKHTDTTNEEIEKLVSGKVKEINE